MSQFCKCIEEFDEQLAPDQMLDTTIAMTKGINPKLLRTTMTPLLRCDTGKPERRSGKPSFAAHSFCPFCGISLTKGGAA